MSTDEDNWRAQYGQVTNYGEAIPKLSVVDIWDWSTVTESRTGGKGKVMRLVGRLVRKSAKLHPSVSSNGALLKTAPVCEVHLDLVRVATGKINVSLICIFLNPWSALPVSFSSFLPFYGNLKFTFRENLQVT